MPTLWNKGPVAVIFWVRLGNFWCLIIEKITFILILGGSHFFHNVAHEFYQRAKTIEFSSQYFGLCLYLPQLASARVLIKAFLPKSRHCVTNLAKHLLISFPLRCTRGTPELSPCAITTLCKLDGPQAGSSAGSRALLQASCKVPVHLGSVRWQRRRSLPLYCVSRGEITVPFDWFFRLHADRHVPTRSGLHVACTKTLPLRFDSTCRPLPLHPAILRWLGLQW